MDKGHEMTLVALVISIFGLRSPPVAWIRFIGWAVPTIRLCPFSRSWWARPTPQFPLRLGSMASLVVVSGKQRGEYLPLGRRTSLIGRTEALPLQILDDMVSRKHLRIRFKETTNRFYAEDMEVQDLLAEAEGLIEGKKPN